MCAFTKVKNTHFALNPLISRLKSVLNAEFSSDELDQKHVYHPLFKLKIERDEQVLEKRKKIINGYIEEIKSKLSSTN